MEEFRIEAWTVAPKLNEVSCNGRTIHLEPKVMQVLVCLADARDVVSKEKLMRTVWPDTFVTDDVLTRCISELRKVFADDAKDPHYIQTIPKGGYRLIAQVFRETSDGFAGTGGPGAKQKEEKTKMWYTASVRLLLGLVLMAALFAGFLALRPTPALADKDVIVLADFTNNTGEPMFDNTLRTALAIDLEQSPFLDVLPDSRVNQTMNLMERPPGDRITSDVAREICLRTSGKAMLAGAIARMGTHYALQLQATNCQTGATLAAVAAEAETREKVLQALGQATSILRSKLGESLASVQKYDKPLDEVTTSSLEALHAYSEGIRVWEQKGDVAAIPFVERALALDRNFASAHAFLGTAYLNLGERGRAIDNISKAYGLRERVTARESYFISFNYYFSVTGELPKAIEQLQVLVQEYPRHRYAHGILGNYYAQLGQWENAANEEREQIRLVPEGLLGYPNLSGACMALGRLDEAQGVLDKAFSRKLDNPFLHYYLYHLAFLRNDTATMRQQLSWAAGKPGVEGYVLSLEAGTQAYYGRMRKARAVLREAEAAALREGAKETAALYQADGAIREAAFGNAASARRMVHAALALSNGRHVRLLAAFAFAGAGDTFNAQNVLEGLNKEFPHDTLVQHYWLPSIRAQIALAKGQAQRAQQLLDPRPYELSSEGAMYPVYVRGQAYLALGNGALAAVEFQKILDHGNFLANDVTGALAHLYLGRARALETRSLEGVAAEGARAKARAAYQDFFNLWKDADPDVPILKQANAEYAKLQ